MEDCDLSLKLSKDEEAKRLGKAQRRLLHLRLINGGQLNNGVLGPPVCIVFEGWDAAGKGGAIKRLVEPLDPRHVHVAPFAAPTPDELRHHFLWRFWPPLPGWGGMTIFDRSWYGRVLVERVENFATEVQWRRAYQEITDFEHSLAEEGMVVIKLWMHMSDEEQLRRFERRRDDPLKAWKLTDEDWRNREKRPQYDEAVADMLRLTNGPLAPWDVISSESKRNGRVEVIETVIRHMEAGMERWGVPVPHSDDEERTELALSFDDAEFQQDPGVGRVEWCGRTAPDRRAMPPDGRRAPQRMSLTDEPVARASRRPGPGITIPFDGIPLHAHREWFARLRELGYTDLWSAEVDGSDGFTPLALAAAWEPELNLGVAITPAYTRGPALLAQSLASMADAAPGRFFCGLGASSQVIVADWNGLAFENQYRRIRDTLRFLRLAFSGEKVTEDFETFQVKGFRLARIPEQLPPSTWRRCGPACCTWPGREADGAILNWLSAEDVATSVAEVDEGGRRGAPRDRRPDLRHRDRGRRRRPHHRPPHDHGLPERARLRRVPPLAGPGPGAPAHVGRLGRRRPQGRAGRHPRRGGGRPRRARVGGGVPGPYPAIRRQRDHGPGAGGDPDRDRPGRGRGGSVAVGRVGRAEELGSGQPTARAGRTRPGRENCTGTDRGPGAHGPRSTSAPHRWPSSPARSGPRRSAPGS